MGPDTCSCLIAWPGLAVKHVRQLNGCQASLGEVQPMAQHLMLHVAAPTGVAGRHTWLCCLGMWASHPRLDTGSPFSILNKIIY